LDLPVGMFKEGFQFDALLIDARAPGSNLTLGDNDPPEDTLQKIVYLANRANIREVWVANRQVLQTPPPS
jgi:guanine deaminase